VTDSEQIYSGRLIKLFCETVELPGGQTTRLEIVRHPGGAVIAPVSDQGEICLLRQYRHAAGGFIWELPAGCIDEGESPRETAERELREETGLLAKEWTTLGSIHPSPGFCDEVLHLYLARDLDTVEISHSADEIIEIHWVPIKQVLDMAHLGEISDSKTIAALFRISPHLESD
jgi:ADP-ribose pyrophosphatase